jgi:hypothetical protein
MTHRRGILESAVAFLKRGSQVRVLPGIPLLSRIRGVRPIPTPPIRGVYSAAFGTNSVHAPPSDDDVMAPLRRVVGS